MKTGQFVFHEFKLHQIVEIFEGTDGVARLSITDGFVSSNVLESNVVELTLETQQISTEFQVLYARLRDLRNLNFPGIRPIFVNFWLQACRTNLPDELTFAARGAELLVTDILDRVRDFQYKGISLLRP